MRRQYAVVCRPWQLRVLYESMVRHCGDFVLHTLAWDWDPAEAPDAVKVTSRDGFLNRHPDYRRLPGPPRAPIDQVATARWRFYQDVGEDTACGVLTLDGDMMFFGSPEPLFEELHAAHAKFAVSPHRIPPAAAGLPGVTLETHRKYGLYNAAVTYLCDYDATEEMAIRTHEWSYTDVRTGADGEPDFGDQGALERVAARHDAYAMKHPGVNLAPWNIHAVKLVERSGIVLVDLWPVVDCRPLVLYHFSSLRLAPDGSLRQYADPAYEVERALGAVELLYQPYLAAIRAAASG